MRRMVIVTMLCFILVGCVARPTFQQTMDARLGRLTIPEAIATWGAPTYERKEPSGGTILVWEWRQATTTGPVGFERGAVQRGWMPYRETTTVQTDTLVLGFNRDGVLSWWSYR